MSRIPRRPCDNPIVKFVALVAILIAACSSETTPSTIDGVEPDIQPVPLASQIGEDRPKEVQKYLIRELQVAGGREAVESLGKVLTDEELCEPAAQALVSIGDGAAGQLRQALPRAKGKCRLTILQNLGVVGDIESASALKSAINYEDQEVRITAVWALANMGDASSADTLLRVADKAEGWERIQATKA